MWLFSVYDFFLLLLKLSTAVCAVVESFFYLNAVAKYASISRLKECQLFERRHAVIHFLEIFMVSSCINHFFSVCTFFFGLFFVLFCCCNVPEWKTTDKCQDCKSLTD